MSDKNSFLITSGNIIALWQLVLLTRTYESITVKEALEIVWDTGLMGGGVPADQGLKLGQVCKLLEINKEQKLSPSQYCKEHILSACEENEPNIIVIRTILLRYISFYNFDWLLFFHEDPEIFKAYLSAEWIDVLEMANLFDFDNIEIRAWWGEVFSRFQTYKEGQKVEIGKVAEKLTLEFEKGRISQDGYTGGIEFVKWASQINDKYGYDILSIRGKLLQESYEEKHPIQIEVKSSVLSNVNEFRFFITRNEWTAALQKIDSYYFYCWTSTNKDKEKAIGPYIIPAASVSSHIPTDNSDLCSWSECRFVVDLVKMSLQAF